MHAASSSDLDSRSGHVPSGGTGVRLSAAVTTHPRRRHEAAALAASQPGLGFEVIEDPDPDGPRSALRTARLAWRRTDPAATHRVLVQDDMRLVPGFGRLVHDAVAAQPDRILCLFTEWGSRTSPAVRLAALAGAGWVPLLDPYVPTTAVVLPAAVAHALAEFPAEPGEPDDVLLWRFAREHRLTPLVSCPNLAEHEPGESLVGNDVLLGPRHSALFGGGAAPWDRVLAPRMVPHLLLFEGIAVCQVPGADGGWTAVRADDFLAPSGLTIPDLLDRYAATAARRDPAGRIRRVIADSLLLQLWLTAFCFGLTACDLLRDAPPAPISGKLYESSPAELQFPGNCRTSDAVAAALRGARGRAGMETFAPGLLRRFVPRHRLAGLARLADPMVREAISDGCAHAGQAHDLFWKDSLQ
ncbi:hypothetical protein CS0771_42890 [Catellatospora sp. IY07-71]|uniref:hypothetical protein n=1 Tax=Catellatospora sp. IY07-71 TaxID=2728827 RepID=UPI001BB31BC5|nr:hypothetical protein [Catellatospora sp. IY07-71]BCJ74745.1 hypothetical protein CS0771_42890 [Catellatospora sp. IY07-71]